MTRLLICALLAAVACDRPTAPTDPSGPTTSTTAPVTNNAPAAPKKATNNEAAPDASRANPESVRQHMQEHWGLAVVVRDAVIAATLDELPDVAGDLADHKAPDGMSKYAAEITKMRAAAERAQKAPNTVEASVAVAELGRACGDCHAAAGATPTLPSEDLPPDENATKAHMLRHDYAARELWAGLVIPSDERWARGAEALAEKPLKKGDFFEDWEVTDALIGLDRSVHQMRTRVAAAATRDERTAVYGALIANCATCHAATADGPVD